MRWSLVSCLLLPLVRLISALSSSGSRLLVLTDDVDADKTKYSQFWSDLEDRGFKTTFTTAKSNPDVFHLDTPAYDHILILPTKLKALGPSLTPKLLLDYANAGGNILLALSASTPTPTSISSLLLELDIHLPTDRDTLVVDHFQYDSLSASTAHDVLLLPPPKPARKDVKDFFSTGNADDVLAIPRAVPQTLGNASPLLSTILSAPATAYSYNTKDEADGVEDPFATGTQLNLISAMQSRNAARITVLGSAEMLEDAWFGASVKTSAVGGKKVKTANREFAKRLSGWTFKELGVLKVGALQHYLSEGVKAGQVVNESSVGVLDVNPTIYRIKNELTYTVQLSEYIWDRWTPFTPPTTDALQLEFTMLSPYHRLPLHAVALSSPASTYTTYTTTFTTPDQHGIFSLRLNYKRPFLTPVDEKRQVSVCHFAHDEFPRSFVISAAYPWIGGVWVTVVGWVGFVGVWLYSRPVRRVEAGRKGQ